MASDVVYVLASFVALVTSSPVPRIVGGGDVGVGEAPWQGSLQLLSGSQWYHLCGCVLYANTRALTAAHCMSSTATSYRVAFGLRSINYDDGTEQYAVLDSYTTHPEYNGNVGSYPNDIAVLRWSDALDTSGSAVSPIALAPTNGHDFTGQSCVLTGWGRLAGEGPVSDMLQKVNMTVMTNTDCAARWGAVIGGMINEGHMCTFLNGTNACHGDYGGGVVCGNTLAGIMSWGLTLCDGLYPSMHSRISYFNNWISSQ